ncbi:MAG TPA: AAA family ATPase [Candidatus Angelobacter sp.]|jgi:dephospho-CoA kinase|nr:AAA family ATPase [Candidatus Angelobacter sp.]
MEAHQYKNRLVIGIAGLLGAGKTTAAQYLVSDHGFRYIRYSEVLARWFNEDPDHKAELQAVGWEVMSGSLQVELNRRLIEQITPEANWVVDGLRHPLDYESLKNIFASGFNLIYIKSPQPERWFRLQTSLRFRAFEDFRRADAHPVEQQIETLEQHADICIQNCGTVERLYKTLTSFVLRLQKGDV